MTHPLDKDTNQTVSSQWTLKEDLTLDGTQGKPVLNAPLGKGQNPSHRDGM